MTLATRDGFRVAEFFAGAGLVRKAIEPCGGRVVFANDIEPFKHRLYAANFDATDFWLGDVREVQGRTVPDIDLATASFPCTDLSLAGKRAGFDGEQSSMFWEFARVLREMKGRKPAAVLLENVPAFATSNAGRDLEEAVRELNELGYVCDLMVVDARFFVPQSRPRLFIIGSKKRVPGALAPEDALLFADPLRPEWVVRFMTTHPDLRLQVLPLAAPSVNRPELSSVIERLPKQHAAWWGPERLTAFVGSLSPLQSERLNEMILSRQMRWATAYRRTRRGQAVWEIRGDGISGCLRTARGGSSKQALVQAGLGELRVRWMTPTEYARLQGADDFDLDSVSANQALFALGDAVCVPAVRWIAESYVSPILSETMVDLLQHAEQAAADRDELTAALADAVRRGRFDPARLQAMAKEYGSRDTQARVASALGLAMSREGLLGHALKDVK